MIKREEIFDDDQMMETLKKVEESDSDSSDSMSEEEPEETMEKKLPMGEDEVEDQQEEEQEEEMEPMVKKDLKQKGKTMEENPVQQKSFIEWLEQFIVELVERIDESSTCAWEDLESWKDLFRWKNNLASLWTLCSIQWIYISIFLKVSFMSMMMSGILMDMTCGLTYHLVIKKLKNYDDYFVDLWKRTLCKWEQFSGELYQDYMNMIDWYMEAIYSGNHTMTVLCAACALSACWLWTWIPYINFVGLSYICLTMPFICNSLFKRKEWKLEGACAKGLCSIQKLAKRGMDSANNFYEKMTTKEKPQKVE